MRGAALTIGKADGKDLGRGVACGKGGGFGAFVIERVGPIATLGEGQRAEAALQGEAAGFGIGGAGVEGAIDGKPGPFGDIRAADIGIHGRQLTAGRGDAFGADAAIGQGTAFGDGKAAVFRDGDRGAVIRADDGEDQILAAFRARGIGDGDGIGEGQLLARGEAVEIRVRNAVGEVGHTAAAIRFALDGADDDVAKRACIIFDRDAIEGDGGEGGRNDMGVGLGRAKGGGAGICIVEDDLGRYALHRVGGGEIEAAILDQGEVLSVRTGEEDGGVIRAGDGDDDVTGEGRLAIGQGQGIDLPEAFAFAQGVDFGIVEIELVPDLSMAIAAAADVDVTGGEDAEIGRFIRRAFGRDRGDRDFVQAPVGQIGIIEEDRPFDRGPGQVVACIGCGEFLHRLGDVAVVDDLRGVIPAGDAQGGLLRMERGAAIGMGFDKVEGDDQVEGIPFAQGIEEGAVAIKADDPDCVDGDGGEDGVAVEAVEIARGQDAIAKRDGDAVDAIDIGTVCFGDLRQVEIGCRGVLGSGRQQMQAQGIGPCRAGEKATVIDKIDAAFAGFRRAHRDFRRVIRAGDGNGQRDGCRSIRRGDGEAVGQRFAQAERLNGGKGIVDLIGPGAVFGQGEAAIAAVAFGAFGNRGEDGFARVDIGDGQGARKGGGGVFGDAACRGAADHRPIIRAGDGDGDHLCRAAIEGRDSDRIGEGFPGGQGLHNHRTWVERVGPVALFVHREMAVTCVAAGAFGEGDEKGFARIGIGDRQLARCGKAGVFRHVARNIARDGGGVVGSGDRDGHFLRVGGPSRIGKGEFIDQRQGFAIGQMIEGGVGAVEGPFRPPVGKGGRHHGRKGVFGQAARGAGRAVQRDGEFETVPRVDIGNGEAARSRKPGIGFDKRGRSRLIEAERDDGGIVASGDGDGDGMGDGVTGTVDRLQGVGQGQAGPFAQPGEGIGRGRECPAEAAARSICGDILQRLGQGIVGAELQHRKQDGSGKARGQGGGIMGDIADRDVDGIRQVDIGNRQAARCKQRFAIRQAGLCRAGDCGGIVGAGDRDRYDLGNRLGIPHHVVAQGDAIGLGQRLALGQAFHDGPVGVARDGKGPCHRAIAIPTEQIA